MNWCYASWISSFGWMNWHSVSWIDAICYANIASWFLALSTPWIELPVLLCASAQFMAKPIHEALLQIMPISAIHCECLHSHSAYFQWKFRSPRRGQPPLREWPRRRACRFEWWASRTWVWSIKDNTILNAFLITCRGSFEFWSAFFFLF